MRKSTLLNQILVLQKGIREQATNDLSDLFLTSLTDRQTDTVIAAIRSIQSADQVTSQLLNKQIALITDALDQPVEQKLQENMLLYIEAVYGEAKAEGLGAIEMGFNPWDTNAQVWNQENAVYWIGKNYSADLSARLRDALLPAFTDGADQRALGKILQDEMQGHISRSTNYFEGLANHIVTRSFNFGIAAGLQEAAVERYKISAVIDERTTDICREMNGKVFTVARAMELANNLIESTDPEEVKTIAPWVQPADLPDVGNNGDQLPVGMAQPPYHWRCRTTIKSLN